MSKIYLFEDNRSFPVAFLIGNDYATVRTFRAVTADEMCGDEYTAEEISVLLMTHAPEKRENNIQPPYRWISGSFFSPLYDGKKIVLQDALGVSRNSKMLGHSPSTDQCVLLMKIDKSGNLYRPFNRTLVTLPGRLSKDVVYSEEMTGSAISIKTDFAGQTWADATVVVKASTNHGYKVCVEGQGYVDALAIPDNIDTPMVYPTLVLSAAETVTKNEFVTVNVECKMPTGELRSDCNSEVFLEPVVGMLPKSRVQLVNGVGSFRVSAFGLDIGDTVRVKAGWRYVPGLGEISITVV